MAGKARRLLARQVKINRTFSYFTHNTFDFRSSEPLDARFDVDEYIELACQGVHEHLMGQSRKG